MPCRHFSQNRRRGGFSLLELVTVLAILSILSAIGGGVFFSRQKELKKDRARADMQVIQQGLEAYRARFGDYPRLPSTYPNGITSDAAYLLNVLNGQIGPAHDVISGQGIASMLNNSLLLLEKPGLPLAAVQDNRILDPWGKPYDYDDEPKKSGGPPTILLFGYSLRSAGPDQTLGTEDDLEAK